MQAVGHHLRKNGKNADKQVPVFLANTRVLKEGKWSRWTNPTTIAVRSLRNVKVNDAASRYKENTDDGQRPEINYNMKTLSRPSDGWGKRLLASKCCDESSDEEEEEEEEAPKRKGKKRKRSQKSTTSTTTAREKTLEGVVARAKVEESSHRYKQL